MLDRMVPVFMHRLLEENCNWTVVETAEELCFSHIEFHQCNSTKEDFDTQGSAEEYS